MTVLDIGLNRIRDLFSDDIGTAGAGNLGTAATPVQQDLFQPIAGLGNTSVTKDPSDKTLALLHVLGASDANGEIVAEWTTSSSGSNLGTVNFHRFTTADVVKTSAQELNRFTTFIFKGNT